MKTNTKTNIPVSLFDKELDFALSLMWLVVLPGAAALIAQLYALESLWLYYVIALVVGVAVNASVAENDDYLVVATVSLLLLLVLTIGETVASRNNTLYLPNDVPVLDSAWTVEKRGV